LDLNNLINQSQLQKYASALADQGLSDSSIRRKLSALTTFQKFLAKKKLVDKPVSRISSPITLASRPTTSAIESSIPASASPAPNRLKSFLFNRYFIVASVLLLLSGLGYTLYTQVFNRANKNLAYSSASSLVAPNRILSFQGRLTDSSGNPITSSTGITFKLFTLGSGGTELYNSGAGNSQTVIPDENGIFSVVIGKTHGLGIASSVFSENAEVWLEITAGGETMNPRQQIATVGYALNSETLQGLPPSASGMKNTVLVIDGSGNLNLGETSPTIYSQSGTLGIIGQAILIGATDGSGGNITINPDGAGKLKFITEGTGSTATGGLIEATNANLASGNLYSAYINNDNRGYKFIDFSNYNVGTTTLSSRFSIDAYGNLASTGTINTSIGITTPRITISVGATSGYILQTDAFGNASWVNPGSAGIGTSYDAGNGLTKVGSLFKFGGAITENTRLNIGNTEVLYVDYVTGNIGMGTTSPRGVLDLMYNGGSNAISSKIYLTRNRSNNGYGAAIWNGHVNSQDYLAFGAKSNGDPTATAIMFLNQDGNVGIGTTAPGYKLHVNGDALISTRLGIGATHPLYAFNVGGTSMLADIFSYGSLGLGTTAPTYKLELVGSNSIFRIGDTAGNTLVDISETSAQFNLPTTFTSTGDVNMANDLNFTNQTASTIRSSAPLYFEAGESFENNDLTLKTFGTGNVVFDSAGLTLLQAQSWTLATGTTNALNVSNGLISIDTLNSRVGIGTSSPTKKLDVAGDINLTGTIYTTGTSGSVGQVLTSTGSGLQWATNVGTTYTFTNGITLTGSNVGLGGTLTSNTSISTSTFGLGIGTAGNFLYNLSVGGTTSVTNLFASGNVGIGTTNPNDALEVNGNIRTTYDRSLPSLILDSSASGDNWTSQGAQIRIGEGISGGNDAVLNMTYTGDGYGYLGTGSLTNGVPSQGYFRFNWNNSNIYTPGSLGIGTSSPTKKLDVAGDINLTGTIFTTGTSGTSGQVLTSTGTGLQWVNAASVGGTYVFSNGLTNTGTFVGLGGTLTSNTTVNTGANSLSFLGLGDTQGLFIGASGYVGIGTTNPITSLDVSGDVRIGPSSGTSVGNLSIKSNVDSTYAGLYANGSGSNTTLITSTKFRSSEVQAPSFTTPGTNQAMSIAPNGTGNLTITQNGVNSFTSYGIGAVANTIVLSAGNVGIGTTSPTAALDVGGSAIAIGRQSSYAATSGLILSDSSGDRWKINKLGLSYDFGITPDSGTNYPFYIKYSNNYVGIGTTSPSKKLDVAGDINLTGTIFSAGVSGTSGQVLTSTGAGLQWVNAASVGGTYVFNNGLTNTAGTVGLGGTLTSNTIINTGANSLSFLGLGNSQSLFIGASGNVGIGTTNPNQLFHIEQSVDGKTAALFANDYSTSSAPYSVNGVDYGALSDNARVGLIAVGSDSGKVELEANPLGTAYTNAGLAGLSRGASGGGQAIGVFGYATNNTNASAYSGGIYGGKFRSTAGSNFNPSGGDTFYGLYSEANTTLAVGGTTPDNRIYGLYSSAIGTTYTSGNITYGGYFTATGANQNFSIYSAAGTNYFNGNVGIGTTNPTAPLEIKGDSTSTIFGNAYSHTLNLNSTSNYPGLVFLTSNTAVAMIREENGSGLTFFTGNATSGSEKLKLSNAGGLSLGSSYISKDPGANNMIIQGSLGVGTTNPGSVLDIQAATAKLALTSTTGTNFAYTSYVNTGDNMSVGINRSNVGGLAVGALGYAGVINVAGAHALQFGTNNTIQATLDSSGNFGIGTTYPSKKLDVAGDINLTGTIFSNGTSGTSGQVLTSTGTGLQWVNAASVGGTYVFNNGLTNTAGTVGLGGTLNSNTQIGTSSFKLDYISSSGNVSLSIGQSNGYIGIGTSSPATPLNVNGTIRAGVTGGNNGQYQLNLANGVLWSLSNTSNSSINYSHNAGTTQNFSFYAPNGINVGIGTTSPQYRLDVAGDINLTGTIFSNGTSGTSGQVLTSTGTGLQWVNSTTIGTTYSFTNGITNTAGTVGLGGTLTSNTQIGTSSFHLDFIGLGGTQSLHIDESGRIGIGTTSPSSATQLDVNGVIRATSYMFVGSYVVGNGNDLFYRSNVGRGSVGFDTVTGGGAYPLYFKSGDGGTYTGGNIAFSTDGVETMRLTSGNVGIGTTAPSKKLDVSGDINLTGTIFSNGTSGTNGQVLTSTGTGLQWVNAASVGGTYTFTNGITNTAGTVGLGGTLTSNTIINTGANSLSFLGLGNSQSLFIGSSGYVGIGTTSPEGTLHIFTGSAGTVTANTNGDDLVIEFASGAGGLSFISPNTSGQNIFFGDNNNSAIGRIYYDHPTNKMQFRTNGSEQLTIDSSGNVGIGTTAPSKKLDIVGDINLTGTIFANGTSGSAGQVLSSTGVGLSWIPTSAIGSTYTFTNGLINTAGTVGLGGTLSSNTIINTGSNTLSFLGLGNSQALFIGASGYVGVGTTNPTTELEVNGSIQATNHLVLGAGSAVKFGNSANSVRGGANYLIFKTNSVDQMAIDASGLVGIGTTAPSKKLDVVGDINLTGTIFSNGTSGTNGQVLTSTGTGIQWVNAGSIGGTYVFTNGITNNGGTVGLGGTLTSNTIINTGANSLSFLGLGNSQSLFIGASGFVGIGTTNPGYKLSFGTVGGNQSIALYDDGNVNNFYGFGAGNSMLKFYSASSAANPEMVITSTGNVGIGTTAPGYKLEVSGDALISTRLGIGSTNILYSLNVGNTANFANLFASGNVGIGTTAPTYKLELVGSNSIFRIGDTAGNTLVDISETSAQFNLPTTFSSSGDVNLAYDLNFTNTTASYIRSNAPLYIQTEHPTNNVDLILSAANSGAVIVDDNLQVGGTFTYNVGASAGYVLQTDANGNASWVASSAIGGTYAFTNGLTNTAGSVGLGGTLNANTTVSTSTFGLGVGTAGNSLYNLSVGGTTSVSNLFASGRVGIGTTAPTQKFQVAGGDIAIETGGNLRVGRSDTTLVNILGITNDMVTIRSAYTTAGLINLADQNGNIKTTLDASSGNFGIGTTNPSKKLDVAGDINLTGTIFSNGTSGTNGQVLTSTGTGLSWVNAASVGGTYTFTNGITNTAGVVRIGGTLTQNTQIGTSSFKLSFIGLGGSQSLYIGPEGNVGIGLTSNSSYQFAVSSALDTYNLTTTTNNNGSARLRVTNNTSKIITLDQYGSTVSGSIYGIPNANLSLLEATGDNFAVLADIGPIAFINGSTETMRLTTGNKVGIGTTAPSKKLDVAGDINLTGTIFSNGTSGTSGQVLTSTGTGLQWVNNVGTTYSFVNGINLTGSNVGLGGTLIQNTNIGTSSFGLSFLSLGNSQALFIGTSGYVGIGNTNPTGKLDVTGSLGTVSINSSANTLSFSRAGSNYINASDAVGTLQFGAQGISSVFQLNGAAAGTFQIRSTATADSLVLRDNFVGIGTSAPTKKLDIVGDINLTGTIFSNGTSGTNGQVLTSTGTGLQWINSANVGGTYTFTNALTNNAGVVGLGGTLTSSTIINTGSNSLSFLGLGNSQALFIGASGNVGIGNTNPSKKLSVDNGNIRITGGELEVYNSGNNPRIILGDSGTTGQYGVLQWDSANDYYRIETNGSNGLKINDNYVSIGNLFPGEPLNVGIGSTYLFTIKSTGNVGIGTTAPSKKLDIAGDINLTGTIFSNGTSGTNGQVLTSTGTGLQWINSANVGGTYTFTNALTNNAGVVGLGGTLTSNTIINTGANSLSFLGLGNSQSLFIGASGYVGIGTTNPEENLVVASSLDPYFTVRATGTNNNAYIKFVSRLSGVDKNSTLFTDWNGNFVARPSGGKFSINTTSTSNTLTLGGNISIGSGYTGFSAPTDGMIVQGNVGIGTTNPSKKLDIAGDINLTGTIFASGITGSSGQILSSTGAGLQWISGAGSTYTFTNGLTNTSGTVRIGGTLTQNTQIGTSSFSLRIGQGNTQPLFISSGGLVGIGNTAPTTALHIGPGTDTPLGISYDVLTLSNNGNTGLALRDSAADLELELSTYNGVAYMGTKTNHDLTFFVNDSMGELTIASSNGFVGVGTTSPTKRLDVAGDIKLTGTIFVGAGVTGSNNQVLASDGAGGLQWITSGGVGSTYTFTNGLTNNAGVVGLGGTLTSNTQIGTSSFSLSYLGLGGSQSLFINNNGYVAIGTNNPSGPFQVNVGGTAALFVSSTGNIGIGTSNPGAKLDIAGASSNISNTSGDITISAASSQIGFSGNSLKNISNITLTGTIFVGAGVTGSNNQVLASNGAGSLQWVAAGGVGTTYVFTNGLTNNSNTIGLGGTLTSNTQIGTSSFSLSYLGLGNSQALFIGTSGYVGIGSTNPSVKLDIVQNINNTASSRVYNSNSGSVASAAFSTQSDNGIFSIGAFSSNYTLTNFAGRAAMITDPSNPSDGVDIVSSLNTGDFRLYTGGYTAAEERLRVTSTGNLGLGTTNPSKKLDVVGDIKLTGTLFVGAGVTGSSGQILASNGAGGLQWVNDAGGTGGVGSTYAFTNGLTNTSGTVGLGGTLTQNTLIGTSSFSLSYLGLGNSQALFIGNSGFVGIGTTNPGYKLEIAGSSDNYLSYLYNSNTGSSAGGLNVRSDGLGNVFNANYAGTDLFTVSPVQTTINNPANFTSAGDISAAYDLNFTNSSSSTIRSSAPLYLTAGEVFNSSNLNLTTYNSGRLVLDTPGGVVLGQAQNWTLGNGTTSTTALNIQSGLLDFDTKDDEIGIGTTNPQAKLQINSYSGGYYLDLGNGQFDPDIITRVGESGYGFRWYYDGSGSGNSNYYRLVSENGAGTPFDMLKFGHTTGGLDIYGGYTSSGVTIEQNGDLKLSGSIFVGAGVTGASGQVLSSNGAGSLQWITPSGASYTSANGVTMVGTVIGLGGSLTSNTTIGTSSFLLNINGSITAGKFSSYTDPTNYYLDPSNSTVTNASASFHGAGSVLFNTFTIGSTQVTITANSSTRLKSFANGFGIATNIGTTGVGSTINWSEAMFVNANGNVGFGTTNPFSDISIGGTGLTFTGLYSFGTNNGIYGESTSGYGVYGKSGSLGGIGGVTSTGFGVVGSSTSTGVGGYFSSTSGNALITLTGKVGIGTTSPTGVFQVNVNGSGGTAALTIAANGKVGIGTSQPALYQLDVRGTNTSGVALFRNLATTGNTVPTIIVQTAGAGLGTTGAEFIRFLAPNGTKIGRVRRNASTTVAYAASGTADLAEFVIATEPTNEGDLISFDNGQYSRATPGKRLAGIHSSYATFVGNEYNADQPNAFPLAISGIVKLKVSTENGPIHQGDPLSGSNIVATASKAIKPGFIVARALQDYTNSDPAQVGTIEVLVNLNWYDPDIMLTDSGEINVNHNISDEVLSSLGYTASKNEIESAQYSLNDSFGRPITRLAQFAQISSAKIKAGLVSTTNLIAKNIVAETTKSKEVQTAVLTPLSDISDTIVVKGKLAATDIQTTSVTTDNLTATDATISTLYAENIISKEGNFGQLMTDKIAALRQEIRNTISSIGVTEAVSTPSALVADMPSWTFNTSTSQTEIHGDVALSDNMVIGAKLSVLGDTQLGNAFVTGTFTAGEVAIKENFIETTAAMLHIQPSGLGSVHIMNDTLIIAENGEVTVNGNLAVSGNINTTSLFANLINTDEINTKKLTAESINVATASATPIIAESGFAALATTSAQVATNATAGTATLPTGKTELVIYNEKITQNSIIYLTPVGSTNNQVVYLKSKHVSPTPTPESTSSATTPSSFVIALDSPLLNNIDINWWIIN
jgi:hypothetical protein